MSFKHAYNRLNTINEIDGAESIFASMFGFVVVVDSRDIKVWTNQFKFSHSKTTLTDKKRIFTKIKLDYDGYSVPAYFMS
jgi:hypothetical protein